MSGGVVVFDARQFVLVIVVRQCVAEFVEGKGGLELPTNTSSKTGASAARSTGILFTDDPVERLNRVGATIALARVATVAGLPALVQGQLREVQELEIKQKQQRSLRAAAVF